MKASKSYNNLAEIPRIDSLRVLKNDRMSVVIKSIQLLNESSDDLCGANSMGI